MSREEPPGDKGPGSGTAAPGSGEGDFKLPLSLSKLPSGRHRLSRGFVEENQRNRILLAALNVFGTRPSREITVKDLITEAHLSRATFYKFFPDRESCFAALYDEAVAWVRDSVGADIGGLEDWASKTQAAAERTVQVLAEDPRLARICTSTALDAGDVIQARHDRVVAELADHLRLGRRERPWGRRLPDSLERFLLAGANSLIRRAIVLDGGPSKTLGPELAEILLMPYLGNEDAHRLVGRKKG